MSGPYGTDEPPAILIRWSDSDGAWIATAVMTEEPIDLDGFDAPSASAGANPAEALQALLTRRFGILSDADCPATLVSIEPVVLEREAR